MAPGMTTYFGVTVATACVCAAIVRSGSHRVGGRTAPTLEQAHAIFEASAAREPQERRQSKGEFPASPWSQDDDFHNKEAKQAKEYANKHRVTVGGVLDALDTGMRAHWETASSSVPSPKVMPCRPRLSY